MEASDNTKIPVFLVDFFSFHILFDLICGILRFLLSSWFLLLCQFQLSRDSKVKYEEKSRNYVLGTRQISHDSNEEADDDDHCCLLGQEINTMIERLGIKHSLEGEELQKRWGFDEICGLFEEEPSLQEVREAFDVFDQNRDGFIDSGELQMVLCGLGLRQGSEMQACRKMIRVFDENGDGKIDFNEFVKFMLNSF